MSTGGENEPVLKSGLTPKAFVPFTLKAREQHTYNTDIFTFALKDESVAPELTPSACIMTRFSGLDGKDVIRPYTPIDQDEKGVLKLLVKVYPQGVMSRHIHALKIGDTLDIKGPMQKLKYEPNRFRRVALICGGTGITPMAQLFDRILSNDEDRTQVLLLTANTSPRDVLLRDKIDALVAKHPDRFQVVYITGAPVGDEKPPEWVHETGHIMREMLEKYLDKPSDDFMVYTCGPPKFMEILSGDKLPDKTQGPLTGLLFEMGYAPSNVYKQ